MKFKDIFFKKGIKGTDEILYENKRQIAFYGRSNVGKSSSINSILGRKKLVKSSATPGKTKEINFFEVEIEREKGGGGFAATPQKTYFVDLPGYGYAKMSKKDREKLRKLILWYLLYSEVQERFNVLVVDSRRGLGDFEYEMIQIFHEKGEEFLILLNKIDKLNQKEKSKIEKEFQKNEYDYILFSAKTGKGIEKFKEKIKNKIFK